MAFWTKQSTANREPEPAPAEFSREFDQRFGIRYQEAKELATEMSNANGYELDWDGLDALEESAHRVIQLDREFLLDLQSEVRKNRRLIEAYPTTPSMFKRHVRDAQDALRQVYVHRRRLRKEGRKRDVLSMEPYPIHDRHGVVVYDIFGSLLFHSRQPTIPMAIAQAKIDSEKALREWQRTQVWPEDRGESVDFQFASLSGVDLSGTDLHGQDFRGANLVNANFAGATINSGYFKNCDLSNADFTGCDLSESNFDNALLNNTTFRSAKLASASFVNANIRHADMSEVDASWTFFYDALIKGVNFRRSIMTNADFDGAEISNCDFSGVQYGATSFRGTAFDFASLTFEGSDLAAFMSAIGLPAITD